MGFCTRCGEITGSAGRCKCGGTSKETASKALFEGSGSDRWQQRYVARPAPPIASRLPATASATRSHEPPAPNRPGAPLPATLASPTKLAQSFLNDGEGELSSVFGSVLSPKDHWQCAACTKQFRQEEVIYPHPDAQGDSSLAETFFCRQCFADRFRKGDCKKCKYAVLSDAPFVKHDGNLWHKECYTCSYCDNPTTDPVIDFAGMPSCEACFDAEAYKHCGIPPSPHLGQSEFFKPTSVLPAPSKWGRPSMAGGATSAARSSPWSSRGASSAAASPAGRAKSATTNTETSKVSRLQFERNKSPIAPSLDELGDKLRRVGLQTPNTATTAPLPALVPPTRPDPSRIPSSMTQLSSSPTEASNASQPGSPRKAGHASQPSSRMKPTPANITPSSPLKPSHAAAPTSAVSPDSCAICDQALGDEDFVELASSAARMHSTCFRCGGCGQHLGGGRFVEAEARWWHRECAPVPKPHRAIITSLQETAAEEDGSSVATTAETPTADDPVCNACGTALGYGRSVTVPRSGRSFHERCFCCAGCSQPFVGEKGFLERKGLPYHAQCAPQLVSHSPTRPTFPAPSASPLPTSRSTRDLPNPVSLPPNFVLPASPTKSSAEPSLFSRRPRPPAGLGGLLICAGCSVRATEKETVLGPRGRKYHAKCLKCRECSRKLDSECRVGDDGLLRCEACRKTASRVPLQANVNTARTLTSS
ncbi:hypothetical protein JCM10908_003250 [Rhodotorula pacifica]|uniref:uncharacterized protein n=1 Tax=Rhodotorula pacifica TaxID=1495444 RepID=UPI0031787E10